MAEACWSVFRDTAVEVEEKNLRELYTLLDTIDYGVLMLEPDLRVRMHNRLPGDVGHAGRPDGARPTFRDVLEYNRTRRAWATSR